MDKVLVNWLSIFQSYDKILFLYNAFNRGNLTNDIVNSNNDNSNSNNNNSNNSNSNNSDSDSNSNSNSNSFSNNK